jgi:predicted dehydrogenase
MKILIAGYGSIGRRHMRNLLALGERDILLYRSHNSTLPVDEIEDFVVETDLHAALAHKPDAVIVSNPTALHLDIAIPAAEAGCHIFMEKPLSDDLEGVDLLEHALQRGGRQLLMGFQFRFHPTLQKAAELIRSGVIGRVISVRAEWGEYLPDWHPWEDYRKGYAARADMGGGVVRTLCHPLDYLRWLIGEVDSLVAFTRSLPELELEVDSVAEISLTFKGGVIGSLHLDYIRRPVRHTLELTGSQGVMSWDNATGRLIWQTAGQNLVSSIVPPANFERNAMFLQQMQHFLQVVRGESNPSCTLEDGRKAQVLVHGALASAQRGEIIRLD